MVDGFSIRLTCMQWHERVCKVVTEHSHGIRGFIPTTADNAFDRALIPMRSQHRGSTPVLLLHMDDMFLKSRKLVSGAFDPSR